jgi:hypothetical protein
MARIPPVTRDRVREDLRRIFDEVSAGPGGVGTGPMSVLKYSPEMARRAMPLFNYVRNESGLPQKVRELAMLTHGPRQRLSLYLERPCRPGPPGRFVRCLGRCPTRPHAAAADVSGGSRGH